MSSRVYVCPVGLCFGSHVGSCRISFRLVWSGSVPSCHVLAVVDRLVTSRPVESCFAGTGRGSRSLVESGCVVSTCVPVSRIAAVEISLVKIC